MNSSPSTQQVVKEVLNSKITLRINAWSTPLQSVFYARPYIHVLLQRVDDNDQDCIWPAQSAFQARSIIYDITCIMYLTLSQAKHTASFSTIYELNKMCLTLSQVKHSMLIQQLAWNQALNHFVWVVKPVVALPIQRTRTRVSQTSERRTPRDWPTNAYELTRMSGHERIGGLGEFIAESCPIASWAKMATVMPT